MKVEIWSDIACPWCYVGKRRFEKALASFPQRDEVDVVWRSFELDPTAPRRQSEPQSVLLARKYRVPLAQAEAMNASMTAAAASEGLDFHFERVQVGNTFDAHRLIHFAAAAGRREEMVERLFSAYLTDGEALGDIDVLVRLAEEVGLDPHAARESLRGDAFADAVRADESRAHAFGISGVPFFAIDEAIGVSGAQPPEALVAAMHQAMFHTDAAEVSDASPAVCNEDGCEV
ncbi:MAG: DsbA family oxidoreductase [Gemmatimonadaceae bacterium]